jgi:hypothetical protein
MIDEESKSIFRLIAPLISKNGVSKKKFFEEYVEEFYEFSSNYKDGYWHISMDKTTGSVIGMGENPSMKILDKDGNNMVVYVWFYEKTILGDAKRIIANEINSIGAPFKKTSSKNINMTFIKNTKPTYIATPIQRPKQPSKPKFIPEQIFHIKIPVTKSFGRDLDNFLFENREKYEKLMERMVKKPIIFIDSDYNPDYGMNIGNIKNGNIEFIISVPYSHSKQQIQELILKRIGKNNKLIKHSITIKDIKVSEKKTKVAKQNRNAPSEHAKDFALNHIKIGNDGKMYIIVVNKNNIKRWKKQ